LEFGTAVSGGFVLVCGLFWVLEAAPDLYLIPDSSALAGLGGIGVDAQHCSAAPSARGTSLANPNKNDPQPQQLPLSFLVFLDSQRRGAK
jgi:hypothetical protein